MPLSLNWTFSTFDILHVLRVHRRTFFSYFILRFFTFRKWIIHSLISAHPQIMRTSFFFALLSIYRFSSGDLTQDIDDGASDPGTSVGRPQPAPLQQQPMPGGPPNVPPPNPPGMMKFNLTRKSWFSLISLSLCLTGDLSIVVNKLLMIISLHIITSNKSLLCCRVIVN